MVWGGKEEEIDYLLKSILLFISFSFPFFGVPGAWFFTAYRLFMSISIDGDSMIYRHHI
jgi:hypothetical protein